MAGWNWQDYLVFGALILAIAYLWTVISKKYLRKSTHGCDKCAASGPVSQRRGVKTIKLDPEESARMRSSLNK